MPATLRPASRLGASDDRTVQMTTDEVGDVTTVPDLLDQIDGSVASVTDDGAYDADVVYDEITRRHPEADVIIQPRSTAIVSESGTTRRDGMCISEQSKGTAGWGGNGALVIADGAWLKRRCFATRPSLDGSFTPGLCPIKKAEARIGCSVLNRMTSLGMPISIRIK
jgi:hypothetical protein